MKKGIGRAIEWGSSMFSEDARVKKGGCGMSICIKWSSVFFQEG